ncbi:hypothetical protein KIN20_012858 [Parelaphostrongylus tenuis]|uniref:CHCH domain-containing protein n=1 Tax=Parelaphostrongylus tenuis TaxID=148309 RepID=A0AAD5MXH4_PARTN|nr:hypothetical protein KIN20_012858 [Parelaphostrongylus tenuis]
MIIRLELAIEALLRLLCLKSIAVMDVSTGNSKDEVFYMTEDEFWEEIKDEYVKSIADLAPDEVYPSNNPGPTKPDGSINFECHCVGHLVASPCGYEFREAVTCQKSSTEKELEEGACADQLLAFMECAIRTQCFKTIPKDDDPPPLDEGGDS